MSGSARTRPALVTAAVATVCLAAYLATPLHTSSGDTFASVLTAMSLLHGQGGRIDTLSLDAVPGAGRRGVYLIERSGGGWVSPYGIGVPLALLPFDAIASAASVPDDVLLGDGFNRAVAALWTALAVALFFAAARRWGDSGAAWFATAALAFGTSALSLLSREVWQHSLVLLLSAAVLALLWRPSPGPSATAALAAGAIAGCAVAARPTAAVLVLAWGWLAWRWDRRRLVRFSLGVVPPLLLLGAYQWAVLGSPFASGQARVGAIRFGAGAIASPGSVLEGLAGVLVSPGRGLLVYSPVLLLVVVPRLLRGAGPRRETGPLALIIAPAVLAIAGNVIAAAAWREWWGGFTYGPRYLSDTLVPWAALLAVALSRRHELTPRRRRLLAASAAALLAVSVAMHAAGVLVDPYGPDSHNRAVQPDAHPESMWRWSDFPPLHNLRVWLRRR